MDIVKFLISKLCNIISCFKERSTN